MLMPSQLKTVSRRATGTAYWLFLVAGIGPLATGIANFVPMSTGTAGGVGFLLLVPLTLISFAAMVAGIIRTARLGKPSSLIALSVLSFLYVAAFFTTDSDLLPVWLTRMLPLVLGLSMVGIAIYGLGTRRKQRPDESAT